MEKINKAYDVPLLDLCPKISTKFNRNALNKKIHLCCMIIRSNFNSKMFIKTRRQSQHSGRAVRGMFVEVGGFNFILN